MSFGPLSRLGGTEPAPNPGTLVLVSMRRAKQFQQLYLLPLDVSQKRAEMGLLTSTGAVCSLFVRFVALPHP